MKYLPELVNQMERIPGGEWLDLKKTKQTVTFPPPKSIICEI
jgi:uncharacterized protein YdaL